MANEIEVFRITPEEGKCYEHIEATRSQYIGAGNRRYFSTNQPRYVGRFIRHESQGYGDGGHSWDIFKDGGEENRVDYSYEGNTCFIEVPCKLNFKSKARNQALRNVYESKTGTPANPGAGPANLIRSFAGIKVPRGAEGGKRKSRRLHKKSKKTRGRR
jgi:hypothetical protein